MFTIRAEEKDMNPTRSWTYLLAGLAAARGVLVSPPLAGGPAVSLREPSPWPLAPVAVPSHFD